MAFGNRQSSGLPLEGGTLTGTLTTAAVTLGGTLNCNSNSITNGGDISAAHANGYMLENAAASDTNPTIIPARSTPTTGMGGLSRYALVSGGTAIAVADSTQQIMTTELLVGGSASAGLNTARALVKGVSGTTTLSGATHTYANLIPAGSLILGTTFRILTTVTGCTSFTIGDGADADRFGNILTLTAGTTGTSSDWTITSPPFYAAATNVVLTAVGGGASFSAGQLRFVVYYLSTSAPGA